MCTKFDRRWWSATFFPHSKTSIRPSVTRFPIDKKVFRGRKAAGGTLSKVKKEYETIFGNKFTEKKSNK
jgi:hypothetical protein